MESFKSPQVLQQKRSDDALSVGSDSAYSTDSGDIRIDLESLSLSDGQTGQMPKQSLSRKNSVCRTNSLHSTLSSGTGSHRASHNGRAHRKLCRLKAVYMRPNNQSSPHSSSESINSISEDKFLEKKNLEDLELLEKQSFRLKSSSLNSSFTYRGITPVMESVLE